MEEVRPNLDDWIGYPSTKTLVRTKCGTSLDEKLEAA